MDDLTAGPLDQAVAERIDQAEARLKSLERELHHSQRLAIIGTIAAGVAHEVNNLLTPALSYAHFAQGRPDDADLQAKALDKIIAGIECASRILTSMLDFAQPRDRDARQLRGGDETPGAVIDETLDVALSCLARDPAKEGIHLRRRIPGGLSVAMPQLALQQVLLNLILNACRAMRQRGGDLTVRAIEQADGQVRIDVADTGPGVPPEIAAKLFQPFVTARIQDGERSDGGTGGTGVTGVTGGSEAAPRGAGLGLSVCRQLIRSAGGDITATSVAGHGATFSFVVPIATRSRSKSA